MTLWMRMSGLLAAMLITPSAFAYCPGLDREWPGYTPDYYSVEREFERALYVVEVRSLHETWLGENGPKPLEPPFQDGAPRPWGFDPYVGAFYDVEVLRAFKGAPQKRLKLFSENSTARFHLWIGRKYLLFVTREDSGTRGLQLTVDTCGNSSESAKSGATRRKVAKLSMHGTSPSGAAAVKREAPFPNDR